MFFRFQHLILPNNPINGPLGSIEGNWEFVLFNKPLDLTLQPVVRHLCVLREVPTSCTCVCSTLGISI